VDSAQDRDLAPIFGDLSQSEKLSEIKPPLKTLQWISMGTSYVYFTLV
jgi:hypothetical protein